jgi:ATP-dependent DNA ligase
MKRTISSTFTALMPMEAKLVDALPDETEWQFEPKWDGFRALILRDGARTAIKSKSGKPLDRYFPELVALIERLPAPACFILDGEIILPLNGILSFDALQQRLHPAASRIARLASETPAELMLFDCLWLGEEDLADRPLAERRGRLEAWHHEVAPPAIHLSPISLQRDEAAAWLARSGGALDGVVAKRRDQPYAPGERAMLKMKQRRTADCVVGGFRETEQGDVASLLLGLYDDDGKLDHVGFTSAIPAKERAQLRETLSPLIAPPGFTGKAPGGPSRWTQGRSSEWLPLRPELVVEVLYDQVTGGRFRHGTRLLRWRPDKAPEQCTCEQLRHEVAPSQMAALPGS